MHQPLHAPIVALSLLCAAQASALEVTRRAPEPVEAGSQVKLAIDASRSSGQVRVAWTFGDGQSLPPTVGATEVTHRYAAAGHYPVVATVSDDVSVRGVSFIQTVHWPLVGTPARSSGIAYDASRRWVYVVNPDHGSIGILDADALTLIAEVPTLARPTSLALAPNGRVWVAHEDDYAIGVVDPDRRAMVATIALPYASQPAGLAFSPRGDAAYVALRATGKLVRIDPSTRKITALLDVGPAAQALAISADGSRILSTRFFSPAARGEVFDVSAADLVLDRTIALEADTGPDTDTSGRGIPNYLRAVAISPDGRSAWVAAKKDNTARGRVLDGLALTPENTVRSILARIDLAQHAERREQRIDLDNRNLPADVCFSPLGDYVFVTAQGNDLVLVLDAYSGSSVGAIDGTGKAPGGVVLSPDGKLFVQAFLSRAVDVFDVREILASRDLAGPTRLAEVPSVQDERLASEVLLGKQIFYNSRDDRMSRQGYLSCASCHLDGMDDQRVWDFTDRGEGLRNTTQLLGRRGAGQGRLHWTANFDEIQDFEHDIRNAFGGRGFLSDEDFRRGTRDQPLGESKAGLSRELDALAAYVGSLEHVHPSPHRDPDGSLTAVALAGRAHFERLGCGSCHAGPDFSDSASGALHDVGTLTPASGGRLGTPLTGLDTPTLLGLWESPPYLHDGSARTVREVFTLRNPEGRHGATHTLSEVELDELVAYLMQLDSERPLRTLPALPGDREAEPGLGCAVGPSVGRPASRAAGLLALALALVALRVRGVLGPTRHVRERKQSG